MKNMETSNLTVGRFGEGIARQYLEKKGYKTIEQNYRTRYCEIDLIVSDKTTLVFVEVRTKKNELFGSPEDTLNKKKLNKLRKGSVWYVYKEKHGKTYRIDAVCIVLGENDKIQRINHYLNITAIF